MISRKEAKNIQLESWINVIDIIYNRIGSCGECRFFNDNRKYPMADPQAMDETNYCYAFNKKKWSTEMIVIKITEDEYETIFEALTEYSVNMSQQASLTKGMNKWNYCMNEYNLAEETLKKIDNLLDKYKDNK